MQSDKLRFDGLEISRCSVPSFMNSISDASEEFVQARGPEPTSPVSEPAGRPRFKRSWEILRSMIQTKTAPSPTSPEQGGLPDVPPPPPRSSLDMGRMRRVERTMQALESRQRQARRTNGYEAALGEIVAQYRALQHDLQDRPPDDPSSGWRSLCKQVVNAQASALLSLAECRRDFRSDEYRKVLALKPSDPELRARACVGLLYLQDPNQHPNTAEHLILSARAPKCATTRRSRRST